jgi:hypothetical protein
MFKPPSRPEDQLLVCVARPTLNEDTTRQIKELLGGGELDWQYVLATASSHGVLALLAQNLQSIGPGLAPSPVVSKLEQENQQNTERCLALAGELTRIVSALTAHGISSISFKGPTLALMAYGDLGLRQFSDLDILVRRDDVAVVKETLAESGFAPATKLSGAQETALLRFDNAYGFRNGHDVLLDVHWRFAPAYFGLELETEDMWQRREAVRIGTSTLFTLSAEDLLLVLCCHGFTHLWTRLGWICDISSLIERRNDLDWNYVLETSKAAGVGRILRLGLLLANDLMGTPELAEAVSETKPDAILRSTADQIWNQLFSQSEKPVGIIDSVIFHMKMREREKDKLKTLLAVLLTPRSYDWTATSVPAGFPSLYYLIRPLRWAVQNGRRMLTGAS